MAGMANWRSILGLFGGRFGFGGSGEAKRQVGRGLELARPR